MLSRFRRGHSTLEALVEMGDSVASAIESRDIVAAVFFDFVKAFDTVLPACRHRLEAPLPTTAP